MRLTALLLPLILMSLPAAAYDDIPRPDTITVTGKGEVKAEADEADLRLTVDSFDRDLDTARRQNDDSVARIQTLAREYGIAARDVSTDQMKMETLREMPRKDRGDPELRRTNPVRGHLVSKRLTVRVRDLVRFNDFYAALLKTGISEINDVGFSTSKLREHRDTARAMAMKAAREKAAAMSGALGQQIGRAVEIREETGSTGSFLQSNRVQSSMSFDEDGAADFSAGDISVTATATVVFELR